VNLFEAINKELQGFRLPDHPAFCLLALSDITGSYGVISRIFVVVFGVEWHGIFFSWKFLHRLSRCDLLSRKYKEFAAGCQQTHEDDAEEDERMFKKNLKK
jgi:hypothetical protein